MSRGTTVLRAALGGAICGSFLGIFGGGLIGVLGGIFLGNVALGLDGALAGGAILALAGAIYGVTVHDQPPRFSVERRRHAGQGTVFASVNQSSSACEQVH